MVISVVFWDWRCDCDVDGVLDGTIFLLCLYKVCYCGCLFRLIVLRCVLDFILVFGLLFWLFVVVGCLGLLVLLFVFDIVCTVLFINLWMIRVFLIICIWVDDVGLVVYVVVDCVLGLIVCRFTLLFLLFDRFVELGTGWICFWLVYLRYIWVNYFVIIC